ncbi:BatA domain-containing protein [Arenibacter troitsensis]|uniref:N-terminal double-transmembrane domain-containing protein n=1 Tax=Arenibacter troitsensis TaxID=188872 RepID=A0A1X7JFP9_9FLAO|nr:BatA domain-containing protein [Arenibacter troitsensis]SMG26603.1 N-terminal double-transmembrane domain-containing protein [Arenibacter troitsensis]
MLFKHPNLLWALSLLLIPIFIHLFQLRRFKKTPFTNVKILKKVEAQSRKSNSLKKWLLLFTRLLLLTALIIAFAQPFIPGKTALKSNEIVIYLDNSLSTQAKMGTATLLENMVQGILKSIPEEEVFTLFTNDKIFKEVRIGDIKNDLLALPYSNNQLQLKEINLKAKTFFSKAEGIRKDLVLISDFQKTINSPTIDTIPDINRHLVKLTPESLVNISIDTVFIHSYSSDNLELKSMLSTNTELDNTPISLYNGERLIAKTSVTFNKNKKGEVIFTIPANELINGEIVITDSGLNYDNQLYFNLAKQDKIKVLSIGDVDSDYLRRIYNKEVFQYSNLSLKSLNYSVLESQNLIILNELNSIPIALQNALQAYKNTGGSLVVIPSSEINMENYNPFLMGLSKTMLVSLVKEERKISQIAFAHPLYKNVFEKEVTNFQYPSVKSYYNIKSAMPKILSYQSGDPFLVGEDGTYLFTASISKENSNILNSPLIVPTLYNMGMASLKMPEIYEMIGSKTTVDIPVSLTKDRILKVSLKDFEFIPFQQSFTNKTTLTFNDYPGVSGIYDITDEGKTIKNISFNLPREESLLHYLDLDDLKASSKNDNISALFQNIEKDNSINELWKWFVILALAFIFIEVLIQKFLK